MASFAALSCQYHFCFSSFQIQLDLAKDESLDSSLSTIVEKRKKFVAKWREADQEDCLRRQFRFVAPMFNLFNDIEIINDCHELD